jgi:3alpha(or 20beta)-hydroxysteroid dehydrogenase
MSIHPAPIRTPMTAGIGDEITAAQPIARKREPEEVTKLLMFMAADATYSTGSEWVVDGGAVLGPVIALPQE